MTMNEPTQPTLPTLPDWTQPQTVAANRLVILIVQGNAAGFRATGLAVVPSGYRVSFDKSHVERKALNARRLLGSVQLDPSAGDPTRRIQLARNETISSGSLSLK